MSDTPFERVTDSPDFDPLAPAGRFELFKLDSGNYPFTPHFFTFFSMAFLLLAYPGLSLLGGGQDLLSMLKDISPGVLIFLLLTTVAFQWGTFFLLLWTTFVEKTGLAGIGLTKFRSVHIAWALSFMLVAFAILSGVEWALAQVGLPLKGEVSLLIPTDPLGRIVWVVVSFTAGFCEESMFRGYLMTRIRLLGKFSGWSIATIVSAIAFGICHAYQGWPGLIAITIYGVLFSLLYIRTGSLWPGIIAHSLWDLGALFFPK
jgi:uncharacterized protein